MTFDKVAKKVGKRPQTAAQIAAKLGYNTTGQAVSKALGVAAKKGLVTRTDKGWVKA
jgi:predicted Rossmann fold nucleotide-binding protein DprA/Smf involved in DNA uptake